MYKLVRKTNNKKSFNKVFVLSDLWYEKWIVKGVKTGSNHWHISHPQLIVLVLSIVGLSHQQDESEAQVLRFDNVIGPETGQYEFAYETSNGIKEEVRLSIFPCFHCFKCHFNRF